MNRCQHGFACMRYASGECFFAEKGTMEPLVRKIESQLDQLTPALALKLPSGRRLGAVNAAVTVTFADWAGLAALAAGHIGKLGEDIVEYRVQLEGAMRDVMAIAAQLLPGSPVGADTGWWTQIMRRAKSLALHTPLKDAQLVQFHYDVSDDFYALWLDPRRVYSCAYFKDAQMSLAR